MTTDNSPSRSLAIKDGSASRRRQTMRAPRRRPPLDEPIGQILAYSAPGARPSTCQPSLPLLRPSPPFWPPRRIVARRSPRSDGGLLPFATLTNSQAMSPHKCRSRAKATLRGIRRTTGSAPARKAPATNDKVLAMVAEAGTDVRGLRDRALLLLGFGGAFRRSELGPPMSPI